MLAYLITIAEFEVKLRELARSWGGPVTICTNVEAHRRRPCFSHVGNRKRKTMNDFLDWAKRTPLPDYEDVQRRLRAGPGNTERTVHNFCRFHSCSDVACNGLH